MYYYTNIYPKNPKFEIQTIKFKIVQIYFKKKTENKFSIINMFKQLRSL